MFSTELIKDISGPKLRQIRYPTSVFRTREGPFPGHGVSYMGRKKKEMGHKKKMGKKKGVSYMGRKKCLEEGGWLRVSGFFPCSVNGPTLNK